MSVRRSIVASVAGRYAGMVVQVLGSLVMARLLTPSEFGLFGVALAVVWISGVLREFGVTNYLIQLPTLTRDAIGKAIGLVSCLSLVLALALWLIRGWVAEFYREPELASLITLSVLGFLLSPLGIGASAALQRELRFVTLNLVQLASAILGLAGGILLAYGGHGAISLVWVQLISTMSTIVLMAVLRPKETFCLPKFTGWQDMIGFGFFATLTGLGGQFQSIATNLILGRSIGFAAVGLFDRANGTVLYLSRDLLGAIMQVMYVGLVRAKSNDSHLEWFAQLALTHVVGLLWPAYAVVAVLAEPLIVTLFGEQWRDAAPLVQVLTLSSAFGTFSSIHWRTLFAKGRTAQLCALDWSLQLARVAAVLTCVLTVGSPLAVAWCLVLMSVIATGAYLIAGQRHVRMPVGALLGIGIQGLVMAAAAALPAFLVMRYGSASMNGVSLLFVAGGTAGVVWIGALFLVRHPLAAELVKLLKKV